MARSDRIPDTPLRYATNARDAAMNACEALRTLVESLRAAECYAIATKYAKVGHQLARTTYRKGQIGYSMFDVYVR